jgi:tetratricopeptide (TPR) repeat protein
MRRERHTTASLIRPSSIFSVLLAVGVLNLSAEPPAPTDADGWGRPPASQSPKPQPVPIKPVQHDQPTGPVLVPAQPTEPALGPSLGPSLPLPQSAEPAQPAEPRLPDVLPPLRPRLPAQQADRVPLRPMAPPVTLVKPLAGGSTEVDPIPTMPRPLDPKTVNPKPGPTPQPKPGPTPQPKPGPTPQPDPGQPGPTDPKFSDADQEKRLRGDILLGAARTSVQLRDFDAAIERFDEYLRLFPEDMKTRKEYAGILVRVGKIKQAVSEYRQVVQDQPDNLQARLGLADLYMIAREYRLAVEQYRAVTQRDPADLKAQIKLGRAYAANLELARARQLYDEKLARIRPGDAVVDRYLVGLANDIERHELAIRLAEPLIEQLQSRPAEPDDIDLVGEVIRAYGRLGDRAKALEYVSQLAQVLPRDVESRHRVLELFVSPLTANTAATELDCEVTLGITAQILAVDPDNALARLRLAQVHIIRYQLDAALDILKSIRPDASVRRRYLSTYAVYHERVGSLLDAKQIYQDLLRQDENDHDSRVALGNVYESLRELDKAIGEQRKVPVTATVFRNAQLGMASSLYEARRFHESILVCRQLLLRDPQDVAAMNQMVRNLMKLGELEKANALLLGYLEQPPRTEGEAAAARIGLALFYLRTGRLLEAQNVAAAAISRPAGRQTAAYYVLARAALRTDNPEKAKAALDQIVSAIGNDTRVRIELADLFLEDRDGAGAAEVLQGILRFEPHHQAALWRMGDAQFFLAQPTADTREALATYQQLVALNRTNYRGLHGMANCHAVLQDYENAVRVQDQIIKLDPELWVVQRERARLLYADHQYGLSESGFAAMLRPTPDERFQAQLLALAQRENRLRQFLAPLATAPIGGDELRSELDKIMPTIDDQELILTINRLVIDYETRCREQSLVSLELAAKRKKDLRQYEAAQAYKAWLAAEPASQDARFELGQVYSDLKQTLKAIDLYADLLAVEPTLRDSAIALDRASMELNPQYRFTGDYFDQSGRGGLAGIQKTRWDNELRFPFRNENEFFYIGFTRANNVGQQDPPLVGSFFNFGGQFQPDERSLAYAKASLQRYPERINSRVVYDIGGLYRITDQLTGRASAFSDNFIENFETMNQDLHRYGFRLGFDAKANRVWNFGANYTFAYLSDVNYLNEFFYYNELLMNPAPKELRLILNVLFQGYANQTIFGPDPFNPLRGAIHPYFAPDRFIRTEGRIEFKHWICRDYFIHSNQLWYLLSLGTAFDNQSVNYWSGRAALNWDAKSWLSLGLDIRGETSEVYRYFWLTGYVHVRFPPYCLGWW